MPAVKYLGEIMIKFLVMKNHLTSIILLKLLCYIILSANCVKTATINQPIYRPFLQHQPITLENLQKIRDTSPNDAVFADLLQAFALLRHANLNDLHKRQEILSLLKTATASFEDMAAPENFSLLFSLDENKPFKGFPHERVWASLMTAILLMADHKYQEALPYLRNAEFFDARFQKMPFGTDAPLIYALMYRCQIEKAHQQDLKNTANNILKSLRFIELKEPLIQALSMLLTIDIRNFSYNRKIAYMIYEISIYHSLLTSSDNADVVNILDDASKHADIFISSLTTNFADEYEVKIKPLMKEFAKVMGLKISKHDMNEVAFIQIAKECQDLAEKMKILIVQDQKINKNITISLAKIDSSFHKIIKAVLSDKMTLVFSGMGPKIIREGPYDEITVIKPNDASIATKLLASKEMKINTACGFNRLAHESFALTLCQNTNNNIDKSTYSSINLMKIWDTSKKATSAQGREFAKILRGRAQFRAATESIAEVSAWSAFFLFYLGTAMLEDCQRKQQGESCYVKGFTLYGIAGATVLFSGAIWLLGKISNPAADSRFIPLLYGEVWLAS